jgi:hypothetical protein
MTTTLNNQASPMPKQLLELADSWNNLSKVTELQHTDSEVCTIRTCILDNSLDYPQYLFDCSQYAKCGNVGSQDSTICLDSGIYSLYCCGDSRTKTFRGCSFELFELSWILVRSPSDVADSVCLQGERSFCWGTGFTDGLGITIWIYGGLRRVFHTASQLLPHSPALWYWQSCL